MRKVVFVRHGESQWNKENRFTGWTDVDLSENGRKESKHAGKLLKNEGFLFDMAYTSFLRRAIHTLWNILDEIDQPWLGVQKTWRLNERHYGALQGRNKNECVHQYGSDQIHRWRRSFSALPPLLDKTDRRFSGNERCYRNFSPDILPLGESLELTLRRVLFYWKKHIVPFLTHRKHLLVVAHGNSIRSMVYHLDEMSKEQIREVEIPTGIPLVYEFTNNLQVVRRFYLSEH